MSDDSYFMYGACQLELDMHTSRYLLKVVTLGMFNVADVIKVVKATTNMHSCTNPVQIQKFIPTS